MGYVRIVLWFFGHAEILAVQSFHKPQPRIKIAPIKNNPPSMAIAMKQQRDPPVVEALGYLDEFFDDWRFFGHAEIVTV